jgi:hypothetical protein
MNMDLTFYLKKTSYAKSPDFELVIENKKLEVRRVRGGEL